MHHGVSQSALVSRVRSPRSIGLAVVATVAGSLAGCGGADQPAIELPPANGGFDYQLGGAYDPGDAVEIVARDRTDEPDADRYSICYVNGFQTQPDEAAFWLDEHPDLLVRGTDGEPATDPEWPDEWILDISTPANRDEVVAIVGAWVDGCAADGYDAVEIDNLDTFTRFPDQLGEDDAAALARALTERAHAAGLAIGQKNAVDLVARREELGFDFAVAEQCTEFDECEAFAEGYGDQVYVVEYDEAAFEQGCERHPELSIVLRDLDLVEPDDPAYERRTC